MTRFTLIAAAVLLTAAGIASATVLSDRVGVSEPDEASSAVEVPTDLGHATPTEAATATPTPSETATATPTPTATSAEDGDADVAAVQQQLTDLRYYVGAIDGKAGPATASAVQAFQKVHGLGADGVIGPNTVAVLAAPTQPTLRGGPADRIEVDLDKQVMYLVRNGALERIMPISSGSGDTYSQPDGGTAQSLTPVGTFTVERHIRGERHAPLGTLYDPMYFYGGWAIHGSNSVPAHPASHGCVRVTRTDATWLFDRVPIGMTVSVYGNRNAFSPAAGETAGTSTPAGDTAETTPDDGIQTEEPTPTPTPAPPPPPAPAPESEPAPTASPSRPEAGTAPPEPSRTEDAAPPGPEAAAPEPAEPTG